MTVIPLGDRILVRPAEGHTEDRPLRGTVIAVGADALVNAGQPESLAVRPGDIILFARHLGCEVTFGGIQYWMMKANDIVTIEVRAVTVSLYGATTTPSGRRRQG